MYRNIRWGSYIHLKDDENGKKDEHKQKETAGVQREQVVFVREVRLKETQILGYMFLNELLVSEACDRLAVEGRLTSWSR